MDFGAFGNGKARTRTRTRTQSNVGIVIARSLLEGLLEQEGQCQQGLVQQGKERTRTRRVLGISTRQKPANNVLEVEVCGFDVSFHSVNALEGQEAEWVKLGVDTSAGKKAWSQSTTFGKILGDANLNFCTVKSGKRLCVEGCDDRGINLRERGVQGRVCKPLLSVGEDTSMGGVAVIL